MSERMLGNIQLNFTRVKTTVKSLKDCQICSFRFKILTAPYFSGGFYSDEVGHVGTSCKLCPTGSFVPFDKAPGTQPSDCKSCPLGKMSILTLTT